VRSFECGVDDRQLVGAAGGEEPQTYVYLFFGHTPREAHSPEVIVPYHRARDLASGDVGCDFLDIFEVEGL
jgi:hypothetical protein